MERRFNLDNARLARSATLDVLLDDVDALDDHPVPLNDVYTHSSLLTLIAARGDEHCVASPYLSHRLMLPLPLVSPA
jgi:hypothetical protein